MTARDIVGGLSKAAVSAARHPVETAEQAIGVARGMVSMGAAAADRLHAATASIATSKGQALAEIETATIDAVEAIVAKLSGIVPDRAVIEQQVKAELAHG